LDRRSALGILGCLLCTRLSATDSRSSKVYRIGYLHPTDATDMLYLPFVRALKDLGYVVGENLVIEARFAENRVERLPALAQELVARRVDVIVAVAPTAIDAARAATQTIPIVMAFSGGDPVKAGFAVSLARPGGNTTGVTSVALDVAPKWIELLRDLVPGVKKIAVLRAPNRPDHTDQVAALRAAAEPNGIGVQTFEVGSVDQFAGAFAAMANAGSQAVVVLTGPAMVSGRDRLLDLVNRHRLPSVYQFSYFVSGGGLVSYGPDIVSMSTRAAVYVDKILRGANPADLPIEQPRKVFLVINRRTASALGLRIPQALLLQADEVIQ
jgi:putative ABC transport system substrate-binding protein